MNSVALNLSVLVGCVQVADAVEHQRMVARIVQDLVPYRLFEDAVRQEVRRQLAGRRSCYRAGTEQEIVGDLCRGYPDVISGLGTRIDWWPEEELVWLASEGRAGKAITPGDRMQLLHLVRGVAGGLEDSIRERLKNRRAEWKVKSR